METEIDFWWNNLQADQRQWYIDNIFDNPDWKAAGNMTVKQWAYRHQDTLSQCADFPPTIYRKV